MSNWNNVEGIHGGSSSQSSLDKEKGFETAATVTAVEKGGHGPLPNVLSAEESHLHRGLKSRHITMIAIGGAIGTGLIIGT